MVQSTFTPMTSSIGLMIDIEESDNTTQLESTTLLELSVVSREVSPHKPFLHDDKDARAKLVAETDLLEQKVILGWFSDFRWMTIALPEKKTMPTQRQY
jgi:hypothetical protein